MPPAQCPECGRFLSRDFVATLTADGTPCPSCETPLRATDVGAGTRSDPPSDAAASAPVAHAPAPSARNERSVAPAEQPPVMAESDPLADWDQGGVIDLDDWRAGQADGPSDAAVIGIAAAIGALFGLLLGKPGRMLALVFGAALGAGVGAASRRIWELEGP